MNVAIIFHTSCSIQSLSTTVFWTMLDNFWSIPLVPCTISFSSFSDDYNAKPILHNQGTHSITEYTCPTELVPQKQYQFGSVHDRLETSYLSLCHFHSFQVIAFLNYYVEISPQLLRALIQRKPLNPQVQQGIFELLQHETGDVHRKRWSKSQITKHIFTPSSTTFHSFHPEPRGRTSQNPCMFTISDVQFFVQQHFADISTTPGSKYLKHNYLHCTAKSSHANVATCMTLLCQTSSFEYLIGFLSFQSCHNTSFIQIACLYSATQALSQPSLSSRLYTFFLPLER